MLLRESVDAARGLGSVWRWIASEEILLLGASALEGAGRLVDGIAERVRLRDGPWGQISIERVWG